MKKNINIQEQDWELLARYLCGESSPEEMDLVKKRIDEDAAFREEFEYLRSNRKYIDMYFSSCQFDDQKAWNRLKVRIDKPVGKTRIMTMIRVAAMVLLVIGAGYLIYNFSSSRKEAAQQNMIVVTDSGKGLQHIILPDSTHVYLNFASKLSYPKEFTGGTREVSIVGEAFFEVSHNPEKPFIIHAAGSKIRVLGTSFNVKAYAKNKVVEVTVKTGRVQFLHDDSLLKKDKPIILTSGDKGVYEKSSGKIERQHNYDVNYIAWLTKSLDFRETPLEEVVEKISEVYQVEIIIDDESLKDYRLNAQFEQKKLSHILQVIELTFDIKAEHKNGVVVLKKRGL